MKCSYVHLPTRIYLIIFLIISSAATKADAEEKLGFYPLCEASAATIITCPDTHGECLLVADNEQRRNLFYFPIQNGNINPKNQKELQLQFYDENEISDIEALVSISKNEIMMFGSYSRNKRCQIKNKRRQFATAQISNKQANIVNQVRSGKISCDHLFGEFLKNNPILKSICNTIDDAEKLASVDCKNSSPFNAEGAIAINKNNRTDIWIGLRAPILPEHPLIKNQKDLAILLHMKNISTYEFDRTALLNLKGRGIRELTLHRGIVWVIAGPANDKSFSNEKESFQLFKFPESDLTTNDVIQPTFVQYLLPYSEGLAISGKSAFVVTDGNIGKGAITKKCLKPSKIQIINLP